jgi:hypothetical protein
MLPTTSWCAGFPAEEFMLLRFLYLSIHSFFGNLGICVGIPPERSMLSTFTTLSQNIYFAQPILFMAELDPNVAMAVLLGIAGITATALTTWKGTSKLYRQGQENLERVLEE